MTSPRLVVILLLVAGGILALAGIAGLAIGLFLAAWLYSLLPPVTIDAPAVGGATTAVGVVLLLLAVAHVAAAAGLARGLPAMLTAAVVLSAAMSLLALGWAVAAAVSAASGSGPPGTMLPAAAGLGLAAGAYAWIAIRLIGLRSSPRARD